MIRELWPIWILVAGLLGAGVILSLEEHYHPCIRREAQTVTETTWLYMNGLSIPSTHTVTRDVCVERKP